jgi:hypothetical protein
MVCPRGEVRSMVAAPCSNIDWLEPVLKTAAEHKEDFRCAPCSCPAAHSVHAAVALVASQQRTTFNHTSVTEACRFKKSERESTMWSLS